MEALESLAKCNLTAEVFRSLALFITYAFHTPSSSASRTPKTQTNTPPGRPRTFSSGPRRPTISTVSEGKDLLSPNLTKRELGTRILQMYTNFICEKGSTSNIKKFARTVTNKVCSLAHSAVTFANQTQWLLHLLTENDAEVVVLGTKIIARLLVILGSNYVSKFTAIKTGGFTILRHRLRRWWDIPTLWPICLSVLFARDVAEIDFERPFELGSLLETFDKTKVVNPGVLPVIMAMMEHGLKDVFSHQDDPDSPLNEKGSVHDQRPSWATSNRIGRHRSMSLAKELELRRQCTLV